MVQLSLTGAVNKTKAVAEALKNRKYAEALRMRGPDFVDLFAKFKFIRHKRVPPIPEQAYRICKVNSMRHGYHSIYVDSFVFALVVILYTCPQVHHCGSVLDCCIAAV